VIVHPQSIVHSLVQFQDSSIKAQLGLPDMRLPIQFALGYPQRLKADYPRFDFTQYPNLTFEPPDTETFRNLALAFQAMAAGGNMPCVLNAANEIAVQEFLKDNIGFLQMSEVVERCLEKINYVSKPTFEDYVETDRETRRLAGELIAKKQFSN
jgi:1-deoxy-D-xylulose-5-phosphate reductoisomerase